MMKILTGYLITNSDIGKRVSYTVVEVDEDGNILSPNTKKSFAAIDQDVLNAISVIETYINNREV